MTVIETEFLPVTKIKKPLIAEKFTKPVWLLWTLVLPQAILLLINLNSWSLIKGDTTAVQKEMALQIFTFEIALISVGCLIPLILYSLKKNLSLLICAALFIANIAYLWLIFAWVHKILPSDATIWILPETEVIFYQFVFIMPVIFYTGLRIACFKSPFGTPADVSVSVAVMILVPLCSYLFTLILSKIILSFHKFGNVSEIFIITFFVSATVITLFAFLRVLTYLYILLNKYKVSHFILLLLVGLAAPIGGLTLNRWIPFPTDFQSIGVYVMAIINGVILLLTFKQGTGKSVIGWFLRCVMYPFSLYFFLVFLPFLPLSLFAIIACGSGFLILTPTALFLVHTRKLLDEAKNIAANFGWQTAVLLFIIGFAVIPGVIISRTYSDKQSLAKAVNAVYSPDYTKSKMNINPQAVKHSLLKLRDMKDGIFLPFISTFYNNVVFNGMVLPDSKMNDMYMMFFGSKIPQINAKDRFSLFSGNRTLGRDVQVPQRNVEISDIKYTEKPQGDFVKTDIQLTLKNNGSENSEFVTDIELDEGVMISGYWLTMGDKKIAGKIFEKKAAMWVYHMIRDFTSRDPGIVVYKENNVAKLSIFPFARNETRTTGIELLYPAGVTPNILIGGRQLDLKQQVTLPPQQILMAKNDDSHVNIIVPAQILHQLPAVQRRPYIHFIVDKSLKAKNSFDSFSKMMADIAENYSSADECKITFANYESSDINDFVAINDIEKTLQSPTVKSISFAGAFCYSNVIKQKLLEFNAQKLSEDNLNVPVFVIIKAPDSNVISIGEMSSFGRITPDVNQYYIALKDGMFEAIRFDNKQTLVSGIEPPAKSVLFKYGDSFALCDRNSSFGLAEFQSDEKDILKVYNADTKTFSEPGNIKMLADDLAYEKGIAVWNKYYETIYYPYKAANESPEIVQMSRQCGIMVPSTSFIVVESAAQIETLKRKEKQSLNANHAFEFDEFMESPAPSILFIAPVAIFLLLKLQRRKKLQ
jgi:hypothetical protein